MHTYSTKNGGTEQYRENLRSMVSQLKTEFSLDN